jgi:outer membrane receptor protein involved in Fe transport
MKRYCIPLASACLITATGAQAGEPPPPESVVIEAGALPGAAIDPGKLPVRVETVTSAELNRFGSASTLDALGRFAGGVSFANAQANPYQPDLFYRGFEASPLAGDSQGLAVYANGVRLNQPFGDTLNWDLVPDAAVDQVTLEGANPVFGLNALGGSVSLRMKNGFGFQGTEAEVSAGSFGRWRGTAQFGAASGATAFYAAADAISDAGWRAHSPSRIFRGFADFGWRGTATELHLDLTGADTDLTGNGTAPVELLRAKRSAVFTYPDNTRNRFVLANLHGTQRVSERLSFQGNLYLSRFDQRTRNGDASEAAPCKDDPSLLCLDEDAVLTDGNGDAIPDFLSGGVYAQLNRTATETTGYGGALQASYDAPLAGRANRLLAGFAIDGGRTTFTARSEIGALGSGRGFEGPGILIDQPDKTIAPVSVTGRNLYYGLYLADVFDVTDALSLSASARLNLAEVELDDRLGTALNGRHRFARLNPALGATYQIASGLNLYGGYSEANRAPTPAEFSCADPAAPCSLTNFFVGDPSLKQVVAHTFEGGVRGNASFSETSLMFHAGFFRTETSDDIQFVASSVLGRAYFRNVGETRRQGIEASLDLDADAWSLSLDYSYTDATFQTGFMLDSPENPGADTDGQIRVRRGDTMPSVPAHLFKAAASYRVLPRLTLVAAMRAASGVYLRGDEANLNPKTGAYAVFDAAASYRLTDTVEVFAGIDNIFDAEYATFGTFSPTAAVPIAEAPGASNPRSLSPAPPRSFFGGLRLRM